MLVVADDRVDRTDELERAGGKDIALLVASSGSAATAAGSRGSSSRFMNHGVTQHAEPVAVPGRESDRLDAQRRIDEAEAVHALQRRAEGAARGARRRIGQEGSQSSSRSTRKSSFGVEQFGQVQCARQAR